MLLGSTDKMKKIIKMKKELTIYNLFPDYNPNYYPGGAGEVDVRALKRFKKIFKQEKIREPKYQKIGAQLLLF